jgi:hypothetical protein
VRLGFVVLLFVFRFGSGKPPAVSGFEQAVKLRRQRGRGGDGLSVSTGRVLAEGAEVAVAAQKQVLQHS